MSQESVNDEQLMEFVKTADPVEESGEGFERIKKDLLGSKARYQFTCQSCTETRVTTEQSYSAGEGSVVRGMRRRVLYSALYSIRSHLYSIPYIGTVFSGLLPSSHELDNYTSGYSLKKAKLAAYEEIKDKFKRCEKCGRFVCSSCFKNGRCADCSNKD